MNMNDVLVSEREEEKHDSDEVEEDEMEEDEVEKDEVEEEEEEEEENSQLDMALAEVYPGDDTSLVLSPDGSMLAFFTPRCNELGDAIWEDDQRPCGDCSQSYLMNTVRPAAPAILAFLAINQLRGFGSIHLPRNIALLIARMAHEQWATNITFGMLPIAGEADAINVIVRDALAPTFEIFLYEYHYVHYGPAEEAIHLAKMLLVALVDKIWDGFSRVTASHAAQHGNPAEWNFDTCAKFTADHFRKCWQFRFYESPWGPTCYRSPCSVKVVRYDLDGKGSASSNIVACIPED